MDKDERMILAGDIGGTNTRLALFSSEGKRADPEAIEVFSSRTYKKFNLAVRAFMERHERPIERACFGVAGPVVHGRCEAPNLAWAVDLEDLQAELGIENVILINDLEANAYGISVLQPDDFALLNEGQAEREGNAALISAGTGLGEAGLIWEGDRYRPFPSEGGHADFAPRNEIEVALLNYLRKEHEHVSFEHVLSGPGLHNIYRFLRDTGGGEEPPWLTDSFAKADPAVIISRAALAKTNPLCEQALDLFVSIYGAEAGNLALKFKATGGVFVGGGIAPKIISKLKEPNFLNAFVSKGRMRILLCNMPVQVILNEKTALLGAAHVARMHNQT
jgi:glucokinase